jgi:pimeloyl-ACP methyl ester carboxylesterase
MTQQAINFKDEGRRAAVSSISRKLAWILIKAVVALLLCCSAIPVLLLFVGTGVPLIISVVLAMVDLGLIVFLLRFAASSLQSMAAIAAVILVSALALWLSQTYATTPPIVDRAGEPVAESIAVLEPVELNGSRQWISIRGRNSDNPILLFLAGGPGGSQMTTGRHALSQLEEHFVVVHWDQPGAGKSFRALPQAELTPERYVQDGLALTELLRQRFNQERIYLLGESWGSVLGIWMAQQAPEMFQAFIGTGQMVAFEETDLICYQFALELAEQRGDTGKVSQLRQQGPPPYYGRGVAMKQINYLQDTYAYMNQDPRIWTNFNTIGDLLSPEYGLLDKVNWARGPLVTLGNVYPMLWQVDLRQSATELEVPMFFLLGRHDVNAPVSLAEDYFHQLQAPEKSLIWFEHSGHSPWTSESDRFVEVIVEEVLPVQDAVAGS